MQNIQRNILSFIVISGFIIFSLNSCKYDQITKEYSDYSKAKENGLYDKGWIPSSLVYSSMTNIFLRNNVDINSCIFYYQLDSTDIKRTQKNIELSDIKTDYPRGVELPDWWLKKIKMINNKVFQTKDENGIVFLMINFQDNTVLGWRN